MSGQTAWDSASPHWPIPGEEALFAGTSSGANVVAALRMAERLGPGKRVVRLLCDSGLKYLSTELYSSTATP